MINKNMDSGYNNLKERMESGYTNINERMESRFGLIAKKFDLLYKEISVRDKEIAVINREIAVIDRENFAIKGNIGEKIQMLEDRLVLLDKQQKRRWWSNMERK